MMLIGPFLTALVPGVIILTLTWWFSKKRFSLLVRILPGTIAIVVAVILFYIGFVNIRGFEGGAYGFLGFFITIFSIISLVVAKKDTTIAR